ncbi:class I SAM-dependent methyltransferase [Neogemmobacter tilapiae]|uniref:ATP synthase subunit beta n=1 Tax=Neogemmobacter tilapiae TaxID=875041 RepID=A0A918WFX0_9RHOB|nr:SAM-dependent methyltransferase [Gemmobacter tilapiae]GHC47662.1 ATP synthase subunit beta [Gemmobacter tilapiae]
MTPLEDLLIRRIAATGPMTLHDYMAECLLNPEHGYYTTRQPFGATGDFTTAPEISQMFGELLGLCLAQAWLDQGSPSPFTLAELGPGRGTLMADILRATRGVPGLHQAAEVWLVEASPALRQTQRQALGQHPAQWADQADNLPDQPLFLIANEFFDALPIRQFHRAPDGWEETMMGLKDGQLTLGRNPALPVAALDHRLADTQSGQIVEICPAAPAILSAITRRLAKGLALIIDYGDWRSLGDTVQALARHQRVPVTQSPGQADITAHVDFQALVPPGLAYRYTTQGALLSALGIAQRSEKLAAKLHGPALENHRAATRRLTGATEMGTLFKALALFPADAPPPAGFPDA